MITLQSVALPELLEQFILNHEEGLSSSTIACFYRPAISDFSRFLGHPAESLDLTKENLNRWIQHKVDAKCPSATIKTRRNAILALWRWAFEQDLIPDEPKRIRKVRLTYLGVDAWTPAEITVLVATAMEGTAQPRRVHRLSTKPADHTAVDSISAASSSCLHWLERGYHLSPKSQHRISTHASRHNTERTPATPLSILATD